MASDLVKRLQRRAEHGGVFHTERKLFGEAATALAEQSRLNAEKEAEAYRLVEALKPFATYMTPGMDCDDKGVPLPDEHGVGWVYLTLGDFRRAAAAIRSLPADKEEAP